MKEADPKSTGPAGSTIIFSWKSILKAVAARYDTTVADILNSSPESTGGKTALYLIKKRTGMDDHRISALFRNAGYEAVRSSYRTFGQELGADGHLSRVLSEIESHAELLAVYECIQRRAREIVASYPAPDFYNDFSEECRLSNSLYNSNPIVRELKTTVSRITKDDFGHGMNHAEKVALDAGALALAETGTLFSASRQDSIIILVQCASLLHDIKRKEKHHAQKGAVEARKILNDYPLDPGEIEDIALAIYNHEAFSEKIKATSDRGKIIAGCLYDSDKFRWGPDNFSDTVWDMVSYSRIPLNEFMKRYPQGLKTLERIKRTFRTEAGRKYGPQFIDTGLAIGRELNPVIRSEFAAYLP